MNQGTWASTAESNALLSESIRAQLLDLEAKDGLAREIVDVESCADQDPEAPHRLVATLLTNRGEKVRVEIDLADFAWRDVH